MGVAEPAPAAEPPAPGPLPAASGAPAAPARSRRWVRHLVLLAKLAIAGGLIAWLATSGRIRGREVAAGLRSPGPVLLSLALLGTTIVWSAARWRLLLRSVGIALRWREVFELTLIGNFFNTVMPGSVGGDPIKAVYATRHAGPGRKVEAVTTVFIDRVIGLATLVLLSVLGIVILPSLSGSDTASRAALRGLTGRLGPILFVLAGLASLLVLPLLAIPSVRRSAALRARVERLPGADLLRRAVLTLRAALANPGALLGAALFSAAAHLATIGVFVVLGRALGPTPSLGQHLVVVPLALTINAIPGPPQGFGVGELAFESLYSLAQGTTASNGAEVCLLWRILLSGWHVVGGGLAYVLYRRPDASMGPSLGSLAATGTDRRDIAP